MRIINVNSGITSKTMKKFKRLCYNKSMAKGRVRGGFTLVELSLSLVFIGVLSITIVLLIQNTTASYRRGVILGQVNTVGMDLIDDFRSSIQNASSDPVTRMCEMYYELNSANRRACINDGANSFVSVTKHADVIVNGKNIGQLPVYGAFCTGTYTYLWNTGYFENTDVGTRSVSGASKAILGTKTSPNMFTDFRLLKIYDNERSICANAMHDQDIYAANNYVPSTTYLDSRVSNRFVISEAMLEDNENGEDAAELLKITDSNDLVLYDLYVAKPALSITRQNLFYSAAFILGTRRGGIDIKKTGDSCKPPSDEYSELEYCAINKFNFAVQAGGK